jgi:hypothetical protein
LKNALAYYSAGVVVVNSAVMHYMHVMIKLNEVCNAMSTSVFKDRLLKVLFRKLTILFSLSFKTANNGTN